MKAKRPRLDRAAVAAMYADYQRLGTLAKCAALHERSIPTMHSLFVRHGFHVAKPRTLAPEVVAKIAHDYFTVGCSEAARRNKRTRQSIWDLLISHGVLVKGEGGRPAKGKVIEWKGMRFTPDKGGYFRLTKNGSRSWPRNKTMLHMMRYEEAHGPIPEGHVILFRDGDRANCEPENLRCVTRKEARRIKGPTGNGWTKFAAEHDRLLREAKELEANHAPAEEIEAAWKAYEALERPNYWSAERKAQHHAMMKALWAKLTPEQRKARGRQVWKTRRRKLEAQGGSVIDRILRAAT